MAQGHDHFHHQLLYHRLHPTEVGEPRPLVPSDDSFRGRGVRLSISAGAPVGRDEAARLLCSIINLQLLLVSGRFGIGGRRLGFWSRIGSNLQAVRSNEEDELRLCACAGLPLCKGKKQSANIFYCIYSEKNIFLLHL